MDISAGFPDDRLRPDMYAEMRKCLIRFCGSSRGNRNPAFDIY